ncbi:MAG TPA: hypothetical protein VE993_01615 [Stellaceae bacterium]|nr:hypothetical protein [Stellaceae bacterium]
MLGSTALSAISKLGAGFAGSQLAQLQESIANSNAALLQNKATLEAAEGKLSLDEGALQQSRTVAAINRTLGAETGKFAASGLNPASGSPLLLEGFSASQGATDLALIGAKAELGNAQALMTAAGTMAQRAGAVGQAASFGMQSTQDVIAGIVGAATSVLQGLTADHGAPWNALMGAARSFASAGGDFVSSMFQPASFGG